MAGRGSQAAIHHHTKAQNALAVNRSGPQTSKFCGEEGDHFHFDDSESLMERIIERSTKGRYVPNVDNEFVWKDDQLIPILEDAPLTISPYSKDRYFKLNVGGSHYIILKENLNKHPKSAMGILVNLPHNSIVNICDAYLEETSEYFFDRSGLIFEEIANFYRTDRLHAPETVCKSSFMQELQFWDIPKSGICEHQLDCEDKNGQKYNVGRRLTAHKVSLKSTRVNRKRQKGHARSIKDIRKVAMTKQAKSLFSGQACSPMRSKLWMSLEQPFSSKTGMVLGITSLFFILATVVLLVIGSLAEFQVSLLYSTQNSLLTSCQKCQLLASNSSNNESLSAEYTEVHPYIEVLDLVCVIWFSFEYILRLWASPDKWKLVISPLSIIDLLSFLPCYGELIAKSLCVCDSMSSITKSMTALRVLRVLRVFRVLRVLKLARFSIGIQLIGTALKHSIPELAMLATFVFIVTILFSTIIYYVEFSSVDSSFTSIPEACWWCIVTFTTVGYGDIVPKTVAGKFIAGIVSFCGVVVLAFPISIIVDKFNRTYSDVKTTMAEPKWNNDSSNALTPQDEDTEERTSADLVVKKRRPRKLGLKFVY